MSSSRKSPDGGNGTLSRLQVSISPRKNDGKDRMNCFRVRSPRKTCGGGEVSQGRLCFTVLESVFFMAVQVMNIKVLKRYFMCALERQPIAGGFVEAPAKICGQMTNNLCSTSLSQSSVVCPHCPWSVPVVRDLSQLLVVCSIFPWSVQLFMFFPQLPIVCFSCPWSV